MPIQILDPTVAAQVAAGEVVERPASVVKELVENAIDAGARRIHVEASGGGLREIVIQDDGSGIRADELEVAFERHATSKLRSADDLWQIGTLGFRGEALPSIASVSQVVCTTRAAGEDLGTEIRIAGGEVQAKVPKGGAQGTRFSIRNLFYNTPVRRDYLRSEATELSAIGAIVQQYALAYPDIRFTLLLDGRLALQTSGNGDLRDVLIEIYGIETARQLLPISAEYGSDLEEIRARGLISPPGLSRSSRNYLHLFVNRRAIQPRGALASAIEEAYHTLLMKGRHPIVVLDLRLHPAAVDVNVHPTKSEVRFRYPNRVFSVVGRSVRDGLIEGAGVQPWRDGTLVPPSLAQSTEASSRNEPPAWSMGAAPRPPMHSSSLSVPPSDQQALTLTEASSELFPPVPTMPNNAIQQPIAAPEAMQNEQPSRVMHAIGNDEISSGAEVLHPVSNELPLQQAMAPRLPPLRVLGQVGLTYIIAEAPEGMYLIDQHAAHERVTYERLMRQRGQGGIESQQLLMPLPVDLPPAAAMILQDHGTELAQWGFELEAWGNGVRVRAVPATLPQDDIQATLLEMADHLVGAGGDTPGRHYEELLITLSCHNSVRAGQVLSHDEQRALIHELEACASPRTCPHGRPTMIVLTPSQLERQFGRRV